MQKEVKAILLSSGLDALNWIVGKTILKDDTVIFLNKTQRTLETNNLAIAHHLYIVDEQANVKIGDWGQSYHNNDITQFNNLPAVNRRNELGGHKIVATTDPKLIADDVPGVSDKFLQQFVEVQGKGKIMMELWKDVRGCMRNGCENEFGHEILYGFNCSDWNKEPATEPKLDESGNAILRIIPEFVSAASQINDNDEDDDYDMDNGNFKINPMEEAAEQYLLKYFGNSNNDLEHTQCFRAFNAGWQANPANEEVERLKQIISTLNMRLTGKYEVPTIYTDEDMVKYGIMCYNQGRKDEENHPLAMNILPLGDYHKSKIK